MTPDILGERQSEQDVRTQHVVLRQLPVLVSSSCAWLAEVVACQRRWPLANIVTSSLGPVGIDKILGDDIGDVTITNDGSTILKMLEVLVELAELQDQEVVNAVQAVKTTNSNGGETKARGANGYFTIALKL
ncbi:hypothetical protein GUJ93_ZPchr0006g45225 [Zizania palustris]|uniref:Uncharacterized protein n=1 Tax=Zizania palustris TaxID=103762 RepID=A0A8J5T064_ZIZPA|nr:hypothetical protein GUJ93_ZPchr0006g45225 [Zizania palustris]